MLRAIFEILICSLIAGGFAAYLPSRPDAQLSASKVYKLLHEDEDNDAANDLANGKPKKKKKSEGFTPLSLTAMTPVASGDRPTGDIVFKDVHFAYPSRPDQPILRGLNLVIPV
jgi:ABC-type multidrug transport system fused ATPase/permease subunit